MSNEISNEDLKKFYVKVRKDRKYLPAFNNLTKRQRDWLRSTFMHQRRLESQLAKLQSRIAGKIYEDIRKAGRRDTGSAEPVQEEAETQSAGPVPQ